MAGPKRSGKFKPHPKVSHDIEIRRSPTRSKKESEWSHVKESARLSCKRRQRKPAHFDEGQDVNRTATSPPSQWRGGELKKNPRFPVKIKPATDRAASGG